MNNHGTSRWRETLDAETPLRDRDEIEGLCTLRDNRKLDPETAARMVAAGLAVEVKQGRYTNHRLTPEGWQALRESNTAPETDGPSLSLGRMS